MMSTCKLETFYTNNYFCPPSDLDQCDDCFVPATRQLSNICWRCVSLSTTRFNVSTTFSNISNDFKTPFAIIVIVMSILIIGLMALTCLMIVRKEFRYACFGNLMQCFNFLEHCYKKKKNILDIDIEKNGDKEDDLEATPVGARFDGAGDVTPNCSAAFSPVALTPNSPILLPDQRMVTRSQRRGNPFLPRIQ